MLVKLPVQFVQKQTKTGPYLDLFVCMLCRIDENCSFVGLEHQSQRIFRFSGYYLVDKKYQRPNI